MAFDYLGATKAGYTPEEIAVELKSRGVSMDVSGAKKAGYSDDEIASEINSRFSSIKSQPSEAPQPPKVTKKTSGNLIADTDFSQKPTYTLPKEISEDTKTTAPQKLAKEEEHKDYGRTSRAFQVAKQKSKYGMPTEREVAQAGEQLSAPSPLELDEQGKPTTGGLEAPWVSPEFAGAGAVRAGVAALGKDALKVASGKGFMAGSIGGDVAAWTAHETVDKSLTDEFKQAHPMLSEAMKVSAALVGGVAGGMAAERRYMQQYQTLLDDVKEGAIPPQQAEEVLRQDSGVSEIINKVEETRTKYAEERAMQDEAIAGGINKELYPEQPKQVDEVVQKPEALTSTQQAEQPPLSPLMEKVNAKLQDMGHEPLIKPKPIQQIDEAGKAVDNLGQPLFSKGDEPSKIPYEEGVKYHQIIPEVTMMDPKKLQVIRSGEVSTVSDEVAKNMKFDEPVEVSLFADGTIGINDGHHRAAAAKQLNLKSIPVKLQGINARGEKINELIEAQNAIKSPLKSVFKSQEDSIDGTTTQSVRTIARKFLGKQYNKLKDDLNIVQTFDDLPEDLRKRTGLQTVEVGGKPRGIYDPVTGKAHLIADSMTDKEVQSVIAHELLHRHIQSGRQVLGADYDTFVLRLKQLKDDKLVKEAMDAVRSAGTPVKHMNEETMAYLVEKYQYAKDISPKLKRFISDIVEKVKVFIAETAVKLGVKPEWLISKMSADEIAQVLKSAAMKSGKSVTKEAGVLKSEGKGSWAKRLTEWHKDSHPLTKNVDGTPKVLYHGSPDVRGIFNDGIYSSPTRGDVAFFTDDIKTAESYADPKRAFDYQNAEEGVIPNYISLKNPMVIDAKGKHWRETEKYIQEAKANGHDGIIIKNSVDYYNNTKGSKSSTVYAVFNDGSGKIKSALTEQMKSRYDGKDIPNAIPNRGTFDETDPNILFSKAKQTITDVKQSSQPANVQAVVEKAIKKNIIEKTLDTGIQKIVTGAIKIADVATARKISGIVSKIIDTEFMKNLIGHKIYKETDYLKIREEALIGVNRIKDQAMKLHNQLSGLSKEAKEAMHDYMTGYKGEVNLTPELKKLADNITKSLDEAGQKLVDEGVLSKEAYEAWKGQYLHRSYTSKMEKAKDILSGRGFTVEGIKQRGKTWEGTTDELYELEKSGAIGKVSEGLIEAETLPNGKVKFRRDWTREERTKMGEVRDAAYTVPETMARLAVLAENSKLLKNIPSHLLLEQGKRTDDEMKELGYTLMRGERYGALNGKWLSNTVADDIKRLGNDMHGDKVAMAYKEYISAIKASHTIYNTVAHVNNTVSNVIMQFTAGLNPVKAIVYASQAVKGLKHLNRLAELESKRLSGLTAKEAAEISKIESNKTVQLLQEAQELGLFGRSGLADILKEYLEPSLDVADSTLSKVKRAFSSAYEAEDNIMRFSAYKQLKEQGMNPKEAMHKINKDIIPDYTNPISKYARWMRDWGFVPFMSWTYHSTPIILKQIKNNPTRALALMGGIAGIDAAFGINPFDEEDIPQEGFAHQHIITGREGDKVDTLRISSMFPQSQMIDPWETYVRSVLTGGIPQLAVGTIGNHNFYFNKPITRKEGIEGAYQMGKHIVQNVFPSPDILDKVYNLAESKVLSKEKRRYDPVIQPKTPAQEAASFFVNVKTYDKAKQRQHAEKERLK